MHNVLQSDIYLLINNRLIILKLLIDMDAKGISYLHAKFQINIIENKEVFKFLELWTLWLKKKTRSKDLKIKRRTKELWNSFQSKILVYFKSIMLINQ